MLDLDHSTAAAVSELTYAETDRNVLDRRRFLQLVGMGVGAGLFASGPTHLLDRLLPGTDPTAWALGPIGPNDGVLVVIGMLGGNDGLNTVVPFEDGNYYQQHGALAIPGGETLQIAPDLGLNSSLTELKRFWDAGQLAIVEGVGYPSQDLSHFSSIANWMGGSVGGVPVTGWLGRWLDGLLGGNRDLFAAAAVGNTVPLHLVGNAQRGTAVPPRRPLFGTGADAIELRMHQAVRSMVTNSQGQWHEAIGRALGDQIDLAQALAPVVPDGLDETSIITQLEVAARLINANLGFRVLTTGWGDFDSHAAQPKMHAKRMGDLNAALARFFTLLDPSWASRVTVMTFSEFGRTSWSNDGQGTDHGSAAPHFVIGRNVRGGLYGMRPTLSGIGRWDRMAHHVDFRSYYTSIIDGWLGGGASTVLGGNFENLQLFSGGPGMPPDSNTLPPAVVSPPSTFVPVDPFRILDTRDGSGGVLNRPLDAGERMRVPVSGIGQVPATGVTAVVANVIAVDPTGPTYFTVYPGSTARPFTSNINAVPGRPVPNLVVMGVGSDGRIEVFNAFGNAHCVVDVFGYFLGTAEGDRFNPLTPARVFDTREGLGIRAGKIQHATPVDIQVAGVCGVPASGAAAVVLNLTVTEPESPGWMRLTPTGQGAASTSNVNFSTFDTVPNLVVCKLGIDGKVTLDGVGTGTHVLADVFGYFAGSGGRLRTLPPQRILDTREGLGAPLARVAASGIRLEVAGHAQVPLGASAVVMNVTATNVQGPSYVTVWPGTEGQPLTSNLNVVGGQTIANLVMCRLGADGAVQMASPISPCDLVADVLGYIAD
jgi:uncharacterized protein (DUF1501 family)